VPGRERQGQQDFLFDQCGDIQLRVGLDRVRRFRVLDLLRRQRTLRQYDESVRYVERVIEPVQATLALEV
jgi:hypothetical protein